MQHVSSQISQSSRGGGRIASNQYRQSLEFSEDFAGLEENTNRYDLLLLVKRVGKAAGFSPRMIQLLDYYMAFTREIDWEEGSRPIVYQSISRTALDLGVSERQIQKLEKRLFEAGAITWNDSGNHKRYGQRDLETGRIQFAFGIDLTPLAYLKAELEDKLHQKQLYDQAWLETKRQISWCRRQIRSMFLECEEGALAIDIQPYEHRYESIAIQIRSHISLEQLRDLLKQHEHLQSELLSQLSVETSATIPEKTQNGSYTSEQEFAHNKHTNPIKNTCSPTGQDCFQKSVAATSVPNDLVSQAGLQHITLKQMLLCASDRFRQHLPLDAQQTNWNGVVEAAYKLRTELGVSQNSWSEACDLLGRAGASVCILLTDSATQRCDNRVRQPAAYFRGMINKAKSGELRLHNSIFGLLGENTVNASECCEQLNYNRRVKLSW